jgi:hypothetical protein
MNAEKEIIRFVNASKYYRSMLRKNSVMTELALKEIKKTLEFLLDK